MTEQDDDFSFDQLEIDEAEAKEAQAKAEAEHEAKVKAEAEANEKLLKKLQKEAEESARKEQKAQELAAKKAQKEAEAKALAEKKAADKEAAAAKRKEDAEAKVVAKELAKEQAKIEKEQARMPFQNDIRQPKEDTDCGRAWAVFTWVSERRGSPASIGEAMELARAEGINEATIRTQYARWRKFHGVSGRIENPTKVVAVPDVATAIATVTDADVAQALTAE